MTQNRITNAWGDDAVLAELGRRVAHERLARDRTQAALGDDAGVSRATVTRLESGQGAQLGSLIRILRALGLLENLDALLPPPTARPMQEIARSESRRRRASGARSPASGRGPWRWGEDR